MIFKRRKHCRCYLACYQCYITLGNYLEKQTSTNLIFWISDFSLFTCCSYDLYSSLSVPIHAVPHIVLLWQQRHLLWMCRHTHADRTAYSRCFINATLLLLMNQPYKDIPVHYSVISDNNQEVGLYIKQNVILVKTFVFYSETAKRSTVCIQKVFKPLHFPFLLLCKNALKKMTSAYSPYPIMTKQNKNDCW